MIYQEKNVITGNVVLSWDGLRRPETRQSGSINYNVAFLINQSAPEVAELNQIATMELNESEFRGTMPPGGHWPLTKVADPAKFGPEHNNHLVVTAGTSRGIPPIVDVNGNPLDAMTYGPMLYPGCVIQVLCNAWSYNNINKGVSFGLMGLKIVDATAPKLPVASGMSPGDVASAFGGAPGAAPAVPGTPGAPGAAPAVPGTPGAPGAAPAVPGTPGAPGAAPAAPQMTPAAQFSYEQYIQAGWDDQKLREAGLLA